MLADDEQPAEQPGQPDSAAVQAPEGSIPEPLTIEVEGRTMTPDQLKEAYSSLHREYTKATQERSMFASALQDFGLLDEGNSGQGELAVGSEQPGSGIGTGRIPTTQYPASYPQANPPQRPSDAQAQEPALPERIEALEATIERLEFGRAHPELDDRSLDQIEQVRAGLEQRYGVPHRLKSVWAEMIVEDARLRYGSQQGNQSRQVAAQQASAAQRKASQAALPVVPGSGNAAMEPPAPARSVDEVIARLTAQAAEEMAGRGHE